MKYVLLALFLTGCAQTTALEVYCPPMREYSRDFNSRLANEIESLPSGTAIEEALSDYVQQRDLIRRCVSERGNL
jgi:hypothetical protein